MTFVLGTAHIPKRRSLKVSKTLTIHRHKQEVNNTGITSHKSTAASATMKKRQILNNTTFKEYQYIETGIIIKSE
jgi:hypothetical protein